MLAHVDAIGLHGFPGTWSIDWTSWRDEIESLHACLGELGRAMPVWITEAGFSTWRHDHMQQVRELLRVIGAATPRAYWYSLQDLAEERATQPGFHVDARHSPLGLFRSDGSPKLAARCLARGGVAQVAGLAELTAPLCRHRDAAHRRHGRGRLPGLQPGRPPCRAGSRHPRRRQPRPRPRRGKPRMAAASPPRAHRRRGRRRARPARHERRGRRRRRGRPSGRPGRRHHQPP